MNEDFQKLKGIGAQKIHEATHISKQHIQSILNESFENMSKVQFLGFISILEREFNLDLGALKAKGKEYFGEKDAQKEEDSTVFVVPEEKKNYTKYYIIIAFILFLFVAFSTISNLSSSSNDQKIETLTSTNIDDIQKDIETMSKVKEINLTDSSEDIVLEENTIEDDVGNTPEIQAQVESFKVIPKVKLWMGYIDLDTYKKYQKLTSKEFTLDPQKEWLLTLGHGRVSFEIDGKVYEYNKKQNIKFLYKDGELKEIDFEEFKELNRGNKW